MQVFPQSSRRQALNIIKKRIIIRFFIIIRKELNAECDIHSEYYRNGQAEERRYTVYDGFAFPSIVVYLIGKY